MAGWLLKVCHAIGLTNLSNEEVSRYAQIKEKPIEITFTQAPIFEQKNSLTIIRGQLHIAVTTTDNH